MKPKAASVKKGAGFVSLEPELNDGPAEYNNIEYTVIPAERHFPHMIRRLLLTTAAALIALSPVQADKIHELAKAGSAAGVKTLLKTSPQLVNLKDGDGLTPLCHAIAGGDKLTLKTLLAMGANPNVKDKEGVTPLHLAANRGDRWITDMLLSKGANPNAKSQSGFTPLHAAVGEGHKSVIELLIKKGAQVNARDADGITPLHLASAESRFSMVQLLLAKGADVRIKNANGETAADLAPTTQIKDCLAGKAVKLAKLEVAKANAKKLEIFNAIKTGDLLLVKSLIEKGADPNQKTSGGVTPVHLSAARGNVTITHYLISKGADINAQTQDGITPLHWAAAEGKTPLVKYLITHGADTYIAAQNGKTAADIAKTEEIRMLLVEGVDAAALEEGTDIGSE